MGGNGFKRIGCRALLPCGVGLARLEIADGFIAVSELHHLLPHLLPLLSGLVCLVAVLLILREARHGIVKFSELIQAAWADEWHGRDRVAKCNRGGTIICFTVVIVIFITQEVHALLRSQHHEDMSTVTWLSISGVAFLALSLCLLANIEKQKMLYDSRRRASTRR